MGEEESEVWNKRDSSDDRNILWIAISMPVFWFWSCTVALQDVESEWNDLCTIFYNCIWTYNYLKIKSLIKNTLSFFLFWGREGTDMKGKIEWKISRPLIELIRHISYKLTGMKYSFLYLAFFLFFFFKGGKKKKSMLYSKLEYHFFFFCFWKFGRCHHRLNTYSTNIVLRTRSMPFAPSFRDTSEQSEP